MSQLNILCDTCPNIFRKTEEIGKRNLNMLVWNKTLNSKLLFLAGEYLQQLPSAS